MQVSFYFLDNLSSAKFYLNFEVLAMDPANANFGLDRRELEVAR